MVVAGRGDPEFCALGGERRPAPYRLWTLASAVTIIFCAMVAVQARSWILTRDLRLVRFAACAGAAVGPGSIRLRAWVGGERFRSGRSLKNALGDMGASAAAVILSLLPLSTAVRLDAVDGIGPGFFCTLALVWAGDTLAYIVGRIGAASAWRRN